LSTCFDVRKTHLSLVNATKKKIEMEDNEQERLDEKKEGKRIDPLQLLFWGLLLTLYGVYGIYSSFKSRSEVNFTSVLFPYIVVLVFGITVSYIGFKGERESTKKEAQGVEERNLP